MATRVNKSHKLMWSSCWMQISSENSQYLDPTVRDEPSWQPPEAMQ